MEHRNKVNELNSLVADLQNVIDGDMSPGQSRETLCKVKDYLVDLGKASCRRPMCSPLTLIELRQMNGETVYCLDLNEDVRVIAYKKGLIQIADERANYCVTGLTIYRKKPAEFEKLI